MGKAPEDLARNPEQRDALAYYKKIEDAIDKSLLRFDDGLLLPSEREQKAKIDQRIKSVLEDQLLHGGKTLISELAQTEAAQTRVNTSSHIQHKNKSYLRNSFSNGIDFCINRGCLLNLSFLLQRTAITF